MTVTNGNATSNKKIISEKRSGDKKKAGNIEDIYPLSPMQSGLLFHTLMNPGTGVYLLQYRHVMTMDNLDLVAFKNAWHHVVQRHEVLRTSFVWKKQKQPLQVVHKNVELPVDILDWRDLDELTQKQKLARLLQEELVKGFDFNKAPLMRVRLIRLDEKRYQFVRSYHHILMDAWCFSIIMMDFLAAYRALVAGKKLNLAKPAAYKRYLMWLQKQDQNSALQFWRDKLSGFDTPTAIPIMKKPIPAGIPETSLLDNEFDKKVAGIKNKESNSKHDNNTQEYTASNQRVDVAECSIHITVEQSRRAKKIAADRQITLNTLVQGAWALLLSRYSNEEDIVFGVTVAGRPIDMPEMATVVGLFINSIPLRWRIKPAQSLVDWLQGLFSENINLREYEFATLADIQKISDVPAQQSLFNSLLIFENAPFDTGLKQENLEFFVSDASNRTHTNYPLTLMVIPDETLHFNIAYHCHLFARQAVERILEHFRTVFVNIVTALENTPEVALNNISMLSANEQDYLFHHWNQPYYTDSQDDYIHHFEKQVEKQGDKVAAYDGCNQLSYRQLNEQVNRLAHSLLEKGIGTDSCVALMSQRSCDLLTMILAVLKCGAAYLPLDPKHPPKRINEIISQYPIDALITQKALSTVLNNAVNDAKAPNILKYEALLAGSNNATNPLIKYHPRQLAYVLFTSGSTGKPKGVMVERKGMLNNILGKIPRLNLNEHDIIAQTASQCFDISVWQCLTASVVGACVHILPDDIAHNPKSLLEYLCDHRVTLLEVVPSLIREMLRLEALPLNLRWLLSIGEALPPDAARQWLTNYPKIPLMNGYGPAECSDNVAYHVIEQQPSPLVSNIPIGITTLNLQLYVLDSNLNPQVTGCIGELYVGGVGVGRGYFNKANLTSERFLPNPFASELGDRMYRTGDLARLNSDGKLEYIGRSDGQVKLRGFRIELGEIESTLGDISVIGLVAVIVREDQPGDQRLVAYYEHSACHGLKEENAEVLAKLNKELATEINNQLAANLPFYMLPSAYVLLPSLPLNNNGKINRRALPVPNYQSIDESEQIAPRTETERTVAKIWKSVLNLNAINVNDNFFILGGHSLLATQAIARLSAELTFDLPLRSLFDFPTVEKLSRHIDVLRSEGNLTLQRDLIQPIANREDLPLSHGQQRLWFLDRLEGPSATYNMPGAIRLRGKFDLAAANTAMQKIIARHEILRTYFQEVDGVAKQRILPTLTLSLGIEELNEAKQKQDLNTLLKEQSMQCFDLEKAPLFSVKCFKLADDEHIICLTMHHIIADAWSLQIFIDEFTRCYASFSQDNSPQNRELELAPLPIQYADYAHWQQQYCQAEQLQKQLQYWQNKLGNAHEVLTLPSDRPRPARQSYCGERIEFMIAPELTVKLRQLAEQQACTPFVILLAAYHIVLARLSGQSEIRVGVPTANRQRLETEGLIGFFVNTQVLVANVNPELQVEQLITQLRKNAIEAQEHQDLPFEFLVNALNPERDLSHSPLFQAMFNFLEGDASEGLQLPGMSVQAIPILSDTAMFDLNLDMHSLAEQYRGSLEFSCDLFDRATAQRFIGYYQTTLANMVSSPKRRVSELAIIPQQEYQRLLSFATSSDNTSVPLTELDNCWLQRFEAQVLIHGDEVAACCDNNSLTYNQLNQRANALALHLLEGHGKYDLCDQVVAILSKRDLSLLVQIIAVFKIGAAYLPLDPKQPAERLRTIVSKAKVAAVLCADDDDKKVFADATYRVYDVSSHLVGANFANSDLTGTDIPNLGIYPRGDQLAYVIFTSGSTGTPKGAMVTQQGMLNNMLSKVPMLGISTRDRIAQTASQCFDISVWQLLTSIITGGRVHILPDTISQDADALAHAVTEQGITLLEIVPSLMNVLVSLEERTSQLTSQLQTLRFLLPTGEALESELAKAWFARFPNIPLVNAYGPAECADDVAMHLVRDGGELGNGYMAIGRPCAHSRLYVLDNNLQVVPVGMTGELYIAGVGVGRGYLHAPNLTAERFIPNPFAGSNNVNASTINSLEINAHKTPINIQAERLYRTGDLARYREDGILEFIGRADYQVKLRGYRIELGEIENHLNRFNAIEQAVVAVAGNLKNQLVAYWIPADKSRTPSDSSLKAYLQKYLPDYMLPSIFMMMDALPLNANGKVDRRALPQPEINTDRKHVLPTTDNESVLLNIWCEILQQQDLSIHDNFFELGGDSILSLQIVAKARQQGLNIRANQIFEHQTVYQLAGVCEKLSKGLEEEQILQRINVNVLTECTDDKPIDKTSSEIPLTPIQQDFFAQGVHQPNHWNMALRFEVLQTLDQAHLAHAVNALISHHDMLRAAFYNINGRIVQTVKAQLPANTFQYSELLVSAYGNSASDFSNSDDRTAAIQALAHHLQASLNLEKGEVFKVGYLNCGEDKPGCLLLVGHHLVVDGVSWRVLLEDLQDLYQQCQASSTTSARPILTLPTKTSAYRDWAQSLSAYEPARHSLKQNAYVSSSVNKRATVEDYWLNIERELLPKEVAKELNSLNYLPVKSDFTQQGNTFGNRRTYDSIIDESLTQALLNRAGKAYQASMQDLLLSAFVMVLCRWSGQQAAWIELESHGREALDDAIDLSRTVGWFTSLYPVYLKADNNDIGATICSVKEYLRAIPQKGLAYGVMKYQRDALANLPRPAITFNYFGQYDQTADTLQWLTPSTESAGPLFDAQNLATALIEINADVLGGQLRVRWSYASQAFDESTIIELAQQFGQQLIALTRHCEKVVATATPSDFPLLMSRQAQLDKLFIDYPLATIDDVYPLSPVQSGMLFHTLYDTQSGVYFDQMTAQVKGTLEQEIFAKAWQVVAARHDILRSGFFVDTFDEAAHVVFNNVDIPLTFHDWQHLEKSAQSSQLEDFLQADIAQGFDLQRPPLMRIAVLQLGAQHYHLVWSHHHIVLDGWCAVSLVEEVFSVYHLLQAGDDAIQLAKRKAPSFKRFIAWLQEHNYQGNTIPADKQGDDYFWRGYLAGFEQATSLPLSHLSSFALNNKDDIDQGYAHCRVSLSMDESSALGRVARQHHTTLACTMQLAWGLLLAAYSSEEDVVFGVASAGRPADLPGIEHMLGMFINTLPLRVRFTSAHSVSDVLTQVQTSLNHIREHEHSPLVEIQAASDIAAGEPLFNSIFVFQSLPARDAVEEHKNACTDTSRLQITIDQSREQTHYPLTLTVVPGETIAVELLYSCEYFDKDTIANLLQRYQDLLLQISQCLARDGKTLLRDLNWLNTEDSRHWQALNSGYSTWCEDFIGGSANIPAASIADNVAGFEAQANADADKVALISGGQSITYQALNQRANQFARYLLTNGVGAESLVVVSLPRNPNLLVTLLALHKVGAAYLPIDPGLSSQRIASILSQVDVSLAIAEKDEAPHFFDGSLAASAEFANDFNNEKNCSSVNKAVYSGAVVCLSELQSSLSEYESTNLCVSYHPSQLAYVLFTSGSTGKPKGVAISRGAFNSFLHGVQQYLKLDSEQRWLAITPLSFDISGLELWLPLLCGATVVLADRAQSLDAEALMALWRQESITHMQATPATWQMLVNAGDDNWPSLIGLCGGEALPRDLAQALLSRGVHLTNVYGPTECTVWSSLHPLTEDSELTNFATREISAHENVDRENLNSVVPIGLPIANNTLHILDRYLKPVPVGVPGELYIGGAALARGYMEQAGLSATAFLPNPFADNGSRIYRTGDLARLRDDGVIEFLGRNDFQVKLRGFRIELGDIEHRLKQHSLVQNTVVVLQNNSQLVAFWQPACSIVEASTAEKIAQLREHMATLPDYMQPSAYQALEYLPLTSSGKIDRKALPIIQQQASSSYLAPQSELEVSLSEIWGELLEQEKIGINDNFFELGGHSLLAMQLKSRIQNQYHCQLDFLALFTQPTIAGLAKLIENAQSFSDSDLDVMDALLEEFE